MRRILIIAATMLLGTSMVQAADEDFGVWVSAEGSKKLSDKFKVSVEGELRSSDNVTRIDRFDVGADLSYKICKYLKASVGYTFIYDNNAAVSNLKLDSPTGYEDGNYIVDYNYTSSYHDTRHRGSVDLTGEYSFGRFTISLRERYQYTYTNKSTAKREKYSLKYSTVYDPTLGGYPYVGSDVLETEKVYDGESDNILRQKLSVEYNTRKCKFDPFASVEIFNSLDESMKWKKMRCTLGVDYKINKKNSLSLSYIFQRKFGNNTNLNVVGVAYSHKF